MKFDATGYLTSTSDVVALSVFEHQMHMMNLLTRIGWEARIGLYEDQDGRDDVEALFRDTAKDLVDYLLFIDEAPFTARIEGSSGFAEKFALRGPFDRNGRSLRQFDLKSRLMHYPCSYMIYSDAFRALPMPAKSAIYRRVWEILSGKESGAKYARLSVADRKAIIEILRDTLEDLPDYFKI